MLVESKATGSIFSAAQQAASKIEVQQALKMVGGKAKELAVSTLPQVAGDAASWAASNPGTAVCAAIAVTGGVAIVAPGVVSAPALTAGGLGGGVVKGSIAAAHQSSIGNVVAPGIFATLQSAGAGGYRLPLVNIAVQGAGAVVVAGAGVAAWAKSKL